MDDDWLDTVKWDANGLVPAIAQDAATRKVLTLAWMNRESLAKTVATGEAHYWSRSRRRLWRKGEESGHVQKVRAVRIDCDEDAVLLEVEQAGGIACHTGRERCFFRKLEGRRWVETEAVVRLADVVESRKAGDPDVSYVARLFARGEDAILKKIGEEATETVMAAKDGDRLRIVGETADLWFHCLIMLAQHGLRPSDVLAELRRREGISGIDEKAARADDARIEAERKRK
jgi:phosphoribosyl-ATP pyrophosphohydrolase/phosphoribosyl-AMP cyclohydrolase